MLDIEPRSAAAMNASEQGHLLSKGKIETIS